MDTFTNADVGGTEMFFDLGSIFVKMDRHSKLEVGYVTTVLEQDDFKLSIGCLYKAHNQYQSYCYMRVSCNSIKHYLVRITCGFQKFCRG